MPPYRDPNRLFYDPVNPVMLTREQMQQLSPLELQSATDQLDQHLILVLQQIEENFAQCNQVVVEELLPAVEQHGENSVRIYESIKFWRPFFEATAAMRLDGTHADDSTSVGTEEVGQNSAASPDRTVSSEGDHSYSRQSEIRGDSEGTPRASSKRHEQDDDSSLPSEPQWSSEDHQYASPFLASNQRNLPPPNSAMKQPRPASSAGGIPDQQLQRLRLRDLPPDSPEVPEPEFETAVFRGGLGGGTSSNVAAPGGGGGGGGGGESKGKARDFDLSLESSPSFSLLRDHSTASHFEPPPRQNTGSEQQGGGGGGGGARSNPNKLLDAVLRKNLGPGSSTPGRARSGASKQQFPSDVPRDWNGIADLSHTALDAFPSPIKRRASIASTAGGAYEEGEDSFTQTMAAAVQPSTTSTLTNKRRISSSSSSAAYLTSSPALVPPKHQSTSSSSSSSHRLPHPPRLPSNYSLSSPSKLSRTPAKYAAKLTARHVYDSLGLGGGGGGGIDSPLPSPPSFLRTNHKPFNLEEHTQRQEQRNSSRLSTAREGGGEGEGEGEFDSSPTTERTHHHRSRTMHNSNPQTHSTTRRPPSRGGREQQPDLSSISTSSSSTILQPPSFVVFGGGGGGEREGRRGGGGKAGQGERDVSITQPFNLYEFKLEQAARERERERTRRQEPSSSSSLLLPDLGTTRGGTDARGEEEVDDVLDEMSLLRGGKTMTFREEQEEEALQQQQQHHQRAFLAHPPIPSSSSLNRAGGAVVDLGGIVNDDDDDEGRRDRDGRQIATSSGGLTGGRLGGVYDDDDGDEEEEEEDELSYLDQDPRGRGLEGGLGEGEDAATEYQYGGGGGAGDDESFDIERGLRGGTEEGGEGGFGTKLMATQMEDTLFGMPQAQSQQSFGASRHDLIEGDDDEFTEQSQEQQQMNPGKKGGANFRLHGLSEMETLHGGELLSSEPFQASPLADRWGLGGGGGGGGGGGASQ